MNNRPGDDLTEKMLQGDLASFEAVVQWYSPDVLRLSFLLLGNRQEAEDVLQESLLKLVQMIREKKIRAANGSVKGLLKTIARNLCIDRLRKRKHFKTISDSAPDFFSGLSHEMTPDVVIDENRFHEALQSALDELNPVQRSVFVLYELSQDSYIEIAKSLGLSTDAVRQHLYRARKILMQKLKAFGSNYERTK